MSLHFAETGDLTSLQNSVAPRILVLQERELPIEPPVRVASAVTLLRMGSLESKVQDNLGRISIVDWSMIGTVSILAGTSKIVSSGTRKLGCLMRTYKKTVVAS